MHTNDLSGNAAHDGERVTLARRQGWAHVLLAAIGMVHVLGVERLDLDEYVDRVKKRQNGMCCNCGERIAVVSSSLFSESMSRTDHGRTRATCHGGCR